jgi:hypothetical protein
MGMQQGLFEKTSNLIDGAPIFSRSTPTFNFDELVAPMFNLSASLDSRPSKVIMKSR